MKILQSVGFFFYVLAVYAGLPLLGWGVNDLPGFFSQAPRGGYILSIAFYGVVIGLMARRPGGMGTVVGKGKEDKFIPRQRIVRILAALMLLGALFFLPFADRRGLAVLGSGTALRWAGLVLEILGMGIILWSGWALGRFYSPDVTLQEGHRLVTDGLYRLVRNPRYLGGIVQGFGLALLFRSWLGLALVFVFILIILFRIRDEEALMQREFGAEWEAYCQKSWRLIPYIY